MLVSNQIRHRQNPSYLAYLSILIFLIHAAIALFFGDNLADVFHDNLVGFERSVCSNAITSILRLEDLDSNTILAS